MAIGEVGQFSSLELGHDPDPFGDRARLFYAGAKQLATDGALKIDRDDTNNGSLTVGLSFGASSGEGIASKRTDGGNEKGLDFYTGSTVRLSITHTGNIGIGTTTLPTEKLEVAGKIKASELEASGTVKAAAFQGNGAALSGKVSTAGDTMSGPLTIQNNLTVSGNVGIGATTPTEKLEVVGKIKTTALEATDTVKASVFQGNFQGNGAGITEVQQLQEEIARLKNLLQNLQNAVNTAEQSANTAQATANTAISKVTNLESRTGTIESRIKHISVNPVDDSTHIKAGSKVLVIQQDGNVVLYERNNRQPVWAAFGLLR